MPTARIRPDLVMHYRLDDFVQVMDTLGIERFHLVGAINFADISADIPNIRGPMLVITTEGSHLASIEQTRAWQQQVPNSELLVLPGDSYHIAATDPDRCAAATLDFIKRRSGAG
jgi:hypothetical protein